MGGAIRGHGPFAMLRTALRPGFLLFLCRRAAGRLALEIAAYRVQRQTGPEGGVGRGAVVLDTGGLNIGPGTTIAAGAVIVAPEAADGSPSLRLGRGVRVGRRVQLGTTPEERLQIGDYSSLHNNCIVLGNVTIGRHCLLSNNIFISSGDHFARISPPMLIKDQDRLVLDDPEARALHSRAVTVDDDCWIGWGAVVRRGVHIGRGAIVGANSVVTRDVPPYEVHGGVPARRIGTRLTFDPPQTVHALTVDHLPYLYSGFDLRANRRKPDDRGAPVIDDTARVVLKTGTWQRLELAAIAVGGEVPISVHVGDRCVGTAVITSSMSQLSWQLTEAPLDRHTPAVPALLRPHVVVTIVRDRGGARTPGAEYFVARAGVA
jgi:acetyltransferase-like isoleucine patch superfamily enzyme